MNLAYLGYFQYRNYLGYLINVSSSKMMIMSNVCYMDHLNPWLHKVKCCSSSMSFNFATSPPQHHLKVVAFSNIVAKQRFSKQDVLMILATHQNHKNLEFFCKV
jgi:hypothetical protein